MGYFINIIDQNSLISCCNHGQRNKHKAKSFSLEISLLLPTYTALYNTIKVHMLSVYIYEKEMICDLVTKEDIHAHTCLHIYS